MCVCVKQTRQLTMTGMKRRERERRERREVRKRERESKSSKRSSHHESLRATARASRSQLETCISLFPSPPLLRLLNCLFPLTAPMRHLLTLAAVKEPADHKNRHSSHHSQNVCNVCYDFTIKLPPKVSLNHGKEFQQLHVQETFPPWLQGHP